MSKFSIALLTLAMDATALVVAPTVTPAKAATNSSKEARRKRKCPKGALQLPTSARQPVPSNGRRS